MQVFFVVLIMWMNDGTFQTVHSSFPTAVECAVSRNIVGPATVARVNAGELKMFSLSPCLKFQEKTEQS